MGVSSNQARLMTLTARLHDLELRAQQISASKMIVAMQTQSAATAYSDSLNSAMMASGGFDSTQVKSADYNSTMTSLSNAEKLLDLELTQINTEHSAVKTEYDSVKSLIGDNVDRSFNVFG